MLVPRYIRHRPDEARAHLDYTIQSRICRKIVAVPNHRCSRTRGCTCSRKSSRKLDQPCSRWYARESRCRTRLLMVVSLNGVNPPILAFPSRHRCSGQRGSFFFLHLSKANCKSSWVRITRIYIKINMLATGSCSSNTFASLAPA